MPKISPVKIEREWGRPLRPLCPNAQRDPAPCDCGYVGEWMFRLWTQPRTCNAKDCFDCRHGSREGHPHIVGYEELCPRCGDAEQFTWDHILATAVRNPAFTGSRDRALDQPLPPHG